MRRTVVWYAFLGAALTQAAAGQTGTRLWRPDERVVLRYFDDVRQVAATNAGVFAVTAGGLTVYDARFNNWLPPVTELDGFPTDRATVVLGDPADESLWIGMRDAVVHYMPVLRQFDRIPILDGVRQLMFDEADPYRGLYVLTSREWVLIPRGGLLASPALDLPPAERHVVSATVGDVLARYPAADALRAQVLVDHARRYRYTSATIDPMNRMAFFGTDGRGILRFDAAVGRLDPLPFGLLSSGVGALELGDGGVWVGTTPDTHGGYRFRTGFTWITEDFQQTRRERGPGMNGFRFGHARDIMMWEGQRWAATDAGLVRFGGGSAQVIDRNSGLPSSDAYVLAVTTAGLWVGTARGVALVQDGGEAVEWIAAIGAGGVINAMVSQGDSLWVGGPSGLLLLPAGTFEVIVPANEWVQPFLLESVMALTTSGARVVMALAERIIWRGEDGQWKLERPLSEVGLITALAGDSAGVWIGGQAGVQFFRFETGDHVAVAGPGDLPGVVRALAVSQGFVWIGTDGGLVRIRKDAILP
ncbi:MAG: hypothetical protein O7I93_14210 [Gemmatimonadetes bacterium]|nr:hypothetical protein [Gemmatimonadota bacterium]